MTKLSEADQDEKRWFNRKYGTLINYLFSKLDVIQE